MKSVAVFLTTLVFVIAELPAQEWIKMQNEGKSFEEIKSAMQAKFAGKSTLKGAPNYDKAYKKFARWEYFWRFQRDVEGKFVTAPQVFTVWNQVQRERVKKRNQTANWTFVGQDVIPNATAIAYAGMGRVNAISFDPSNVNTVYAGAANGGLWKSTNAGVNWVEVGGNLPVLGISDIAISQSGDTLYIATGDADGQHSLTVGVLKSINGGNTFSTTGLTHMTTDDASSQFQIHHLWVHPNNPNIVVATTTESTQKTTNGGDTWSVVDGFPGSDIKQRPGMPDVLFVGSENVVIRSTDGGATWPDVVHTFTNTANKVDLAVSGTVVYAITNDGQGAKSIDGGNSWAAMTLPGQYDSQGGYNMAIAADPSNSNRVMLGGVQGWISTNGGTTWALHLNGVEEVPADPGKYVHSDHHMIKFVPGNNSLLFSAHDGGIHMGNFFDLNATWTDLSVDLKITQYYGMDGFPGAENVLIAGAQDQDGVFYNGTNWININNNSDGTGGAINPTNSNISFCKSQSGFVARTLNGWTNSTNVSPQPANGNDQADFVWPLAMDPTTPTTLYAGYGNIYKTTTNGDMWNDVTNDGDLTPYTSISVAPSNPMVVYVIKGNTTVRHSDNAGTNWNTLTAPATGGAMITKIKASPTTASTVYVSCGNYITGNKVFMSTNSGANWTNISAGIPNIPVFCVVEHAASGDLYAGTQFGVYKRAAAGGNWVAYNTGLPPVSVYDLNIYAGGNILRAATFGRAIWKTPINGGGGEPCNPVNTTTVLQGDIAGGATFHDGTIMSGALGAGKVTINANNITFRGVNAVNINPEFEVQSPNVFNIEIGPCN